MKRTFLVLSLISLATTIWSYCSPPPGDPPSCSSQGHPTVPDSTYDNVGYIYSFPCCNDNYVCGSDKHVQFDKQCTTYYDDNGNWCTDLNNAQNKYSTDPICCR